MVTRDEGVGEQHIETDNEMFKTMVINSAIISDHALYPYEKALEELLEVQGVPVREAAHGGWVSLLERREG